MKIAYIGGGSRGWAWNFMMDLASDADLSGEVRLYDIDLDAAKANEIIGNKISALPDAVGRWKYTAVSSLKDALSGADAVIISILPGTFDEMRSDVHAPEKYGVYQSVGDTTGPGGFVRAMRSVPMFEVIGRAIGEYAPNAWVINYSNPLAVNLRTLYDVFPRIKAFGCCHEVFGTQQLLANVYNIASGDSVTRQDVKINVTGLNHFTWIDSATCGTTDLLPLYADFANKYYETGYEEISGNWLNSFFACAHRVKFDLFRRYGVIAAAGDRHLAEFIPDYLKDRETVSEWKFSLTTVDWRVEDLHRRLARSKALTDGTENPVLRPSGEEGHLLIKALFGYGDMVSNVNLPNTGQIPDLPSGVVVETNALFRNGKITPVIAGPLPVSIQPLISHHANLQTLTLKSAQNSDFGFASNVFSLDPIAARLSRKQCDTLLREMLVNTRKYLPDTWKL